MWITLPIVRCHARHEALRVEAHFIRAWKPTLNASDRPFWMMKERYSDELRRRTRSQRSKPTPKAPEAAERRPRPALTVYRLRTEQGDQCWFDFGGILKEAAEKGESVTVVIEPGKKDITKWGRIQRQFGDTRARICAAGHAPQRVTLDTWGREEMLTAESVQLTATPEQRDRPETGELKAAMAELGTLCSHLETVSEEDLAFYWRCRDVLERESRVRVRSLVWKECMRRYEGMTNKPISLRLPYCRNVDAAAVKQAVVSRIRGHNAWPEFLREWHVKHLRIVTSSADSILQILENVQRTHAHGTACCCAQVEARLRAAGYTTPLPRVDGHIFLVGREYEGPNSAALKVAATNIPKPTRWDFSRAWQRLHQELPKDLIGEAEWSSTLNRVWKSDRATRLEQQWPTTRDVWRLRKLLDGLVIGHIDRNPGELSAVCPVLYQQALDALYNTSTGYKEIFPCRADARSLRGLTVDEANERMKAPEPQRSIGAAADVVRTWRKLYQKRGWSKFAGYNSKGGFNTPYVLFKAKNILDPAIRAEKWRKARPIAPGTKHPMQKLLHLAGRAWSFITSAANLKGEHFVIQHSGQVPAFLAKAQRLVPPGALGYVIKDIEGAYPSCPKGEIALALRDIVAELKHDGRTGIAVPKRSKAKSCAWKTRKGDVWMPFEVLCDIADFSLHNAIVSVDGRLLHQTQGIPMGDPLSPAMCVGTCAWMEKEWMQTLTAWDKQHFCAARFMDDILLFYRKSTRWGHRAFLTDFARSECYHPPLKLEDAKDDTFLETTFEIEGQRIRHWLKNDNKRGAPPKIWRYQHFASYSSFAQKRATLTACLRKVQAMASDGAALRSSAVQKLSEFHALEYPAAILRGVCTYLAARSGRYEWIQVRDEISQWQ